MRVVISLLNFRPAQIGGTESYLRSLLEHLPNVREPEDELFVVGHRDNADSIPSTGVEWIIVPRSGRSIVLARCLEAFTPIRIQSVEKAISRIRPDVALFPQQSLFPKHPLCPSVLIAHDLQHLILPQHFALFDRCFRAAIYPLSMRRAEKIVAVSEFTRRMLIEHCGVAPEKVVAIPHGYTPHPPDPGLSPRDSEAPYLYFPAASYQQKGHKTLFRSYAALRREGDFPYKLLLTGQQTPYWNDLRRLIDALRIADDVTHLGFVSHDEVCRTYRGAAAVVFPTEFEGFGLPVLEAVQYGKKIICSRLEVFDELGVPRQFQIDFADPRQLRTALALPGVTVLNKEPLSWDESAARLLTVLRSVAKSAP